MITKAKRSNMGSRKLALPILDSDILYRSWKNKIQMWALVCGVDKKEQGIILLQMLCKYKGRKSSINFDC